MISSILGSLRSCLKGKELFDEGYRSGSEKEEDKNWGTSKLRYVRWFVVTGVPPGTMLSKSERVQLLAFGVEGTIRSSLAFVAIPPGAIFCTPQRELLELGVVVKGARSALTILSKSRRVQLLTFGVEGTIRSSLALVIPPIRMIRYAYNTHMIRVSYAKKC